jgi:hypothetical protein
MALVLGVFVTFYGLMYVGATVWEYVYRPNIAYSVQRADCSQAAIEASNMGVAGSHLTSCVITIKAQNLKNNPEYIDYDGVGGGPFASWHPLIKIQASDGKFCYATPTGDNYGSFAANQTLYLTLRCFVTPDKPPKNYDENSDADPVSITIGGYSGATLYIKPTW